MPAGSRRRGRRGCRGNHRGHPYFRFAIVLDYRQPRHGLAKHSRLAAPSLTRIQVSYVLTRHYSSSRPNSSKLFKTCADVLWINDSSNDRFIFLGGFLTRSFLRANR